MVKKRKKIIFINPLRKISSHNIWCFINSVNPPIGLATLAAILEQHSHRIKIIDANALNLGLDEILTHIDSDTNFVGLTATTPEINAAITIAQAVRKSFPSIKIVMGGVHPTLFHHGLVTQGVCDFVIRNEAEESILMLVETDQYEDIPNLTWSSGKEVIINPDAKTYAELDHLPFPAYHKMPMHKYHSALGAAKRSPSLGVITSRGCPGKCTFCYSSMFGTKIRFMSPERVVEHIQLLKDKYHIREISFYDDTFTTHKKRIEKLCGLFISKRLNITWSCFSRVDCVDEKLLNLMKKAGCHQVMYGFESVEKDVLKAIKKKIKLSQFDEAIQWTKRAKIDIRGAFMLGNPCETEKSIQKTIQYSKNVGIQYAIYNITTPFPGTEMYREAKENNTLLHENWDLYDLAHPVLKLPTIQSEIVINYYHKAFKEFYLRFSYILKWVFRIRTINEILIYVKAGFNVSIILLSRFLSKRFKLL